MRTATFMITGRIGTSFSRMSIVGLVDFLAPDLEQRLDAYALCPNVAAVREHLGWDNENPLRRISLNSLAGNSAS